MLNTAHITATLGNLQYQSHIFAAQIFRALLPATNTARLLFPSVVNIEASPGDTASIELQYNENTANVISGEVRSVERRPRHTIVILSDGSFALNRYRPGSTFEQQNAKNVAQALASDVGLSVGNVSVDLSLPQYAAHQKRTAAEHIAKLAELSDGFAYIDGDGKLQISTWSEGPADAAIRYGRDLIDYSFTKQQNRSAVSPIGNGPSGSADAPDAMRYGTGSLPESVADPGADNIWSAQHMLRTPSAVQTAQTGMNRVRSQRNGQALLTTLMRPDFFPGMKLEIQDVPQTDERWIITHITHEIAQHSHAKTYLRARQDATGDSLLGAALGAIGGLL